MSIVKTHLKGIQTKVQELRIAEGAILGEDVQRAGRGSKRC